MAAVAYVLARLNPFGSTARSGVASGAARPAQTLDIQQSIAALEDKRSEVAADVARARASLSRWTGDPNPEVEGGMPDFAIDPAGLRTAIDRHPDLGAAIARTRQAEADIGLARAEKRPDWAFDVAYQRRADRYGDMVSAGVTMSLPLFTRNRSEEH